MTRSTQLLRELERLQASFGGAEAAAKLRLLEQLEGTAMPSARATLRLHESLCFLRAHPDDGAVLARVAAMLDGFDRRRDLRRFRRALADTGVAGTAIRFSFFAATARWLSRRFPGALRVVWPGYERGELLLQRLSHLVAWAETPGLDEIAWSARDWVQRLAGPHVGDADFLLARWERLGGAELARAAFFDELELELELQPGPDTPSRSRAALPELVPSGRVSFQTAPLRRERPDLERELSRPVRCRALDERAGQRVIDAAREAMALRQRDLYAFANADARDVRLYDCGDGLAFAVVGITPARRLLLEAVYAYLTLKNGVPIGYVLTSGFFKSSEVAYNVFDTWRGGEAAHVYACALRVTKHLFAADTFTVYPYHLGGYGNEEGLRSGAGSFYQKLGFRAREPAVLATMEQELRKISKRPSYRTPVSTLAELAQHNVYFSTGRARDDGVGVFPLSEIGLAVADYLAARFGADRERGERVCADEAARLCGAGRWRSWPGDEQRWWLRWAPLIRVLPGVERWPAAARRSLVAVVRAKGGRRETDYVRRLDRHLRLRAALRALAAAER